MNGLKNKCRQSVNLTLNDGDEVGDGGDGARAGRPLAKALGGGPPPPPTSRRYFRMWRLEG